MDDIQRGEIWWADLPEPRRSERGYQRPVLVIQADSFNRSRIQTVIVAAITSNLDLADAPGNVMLPARSSGLPRDSVVNVSQVLRANRRPASRDPCKRADSVPACSVRKLRSRVCDAQERCSGQSWDTLAPATTARKTSGSDALLKDPSRDFVKLPRVCSTSKSADRARHWTQTQVVGAISVHPPHKEGMH